jgi:signal transduction histidine kinase
LALTKQIVEEHGGRIEISSELGRGTLVRLQLPVGAPKA